MRDYCKGIASEFPKDDEHIPQIRRLKKGNAKEERIIADYIGETVNYVWLEKY